MSISIQNYKTLNFYFGDVIDSMENDLLRILISKNQHHLLTEFDEILRLLENEKGLAELINRYKTKYIKDFGRFESLISEIRAGYFLKNQGLPVEFLSDTARKGRSADIKTKIGDRDAYVEVKKITRKELEEDKIIDELRKLKIPFCLTVIISKRVYSARDVAKEIECTLEDLACSSFPIELEFKYGRLTIYGKGSTGLYGVVYSYSVTNERKYDSYSFITREDLERKIESDLNDATDQLLNTANESDILFVLIDNADVHFMDHFYVFDKFYGGVEVLHMQDMEKPEIRIHPKITEAKKKSWENFLQDLNFIPTTRYIDFIKNSGWIFYSKYADDLNGIFYISGGDFKYNNHCIFLNPFVGQKRNFSDLQSIFKYYNPEKE